MRKLTKAISRETLSTDRKGRPLVVTLEPGDMITFRPKGNRVSVSVYLGHCMMLAQIIDAEQRYKQAVADYKEAKKLGQRKRRPRKPCLPFSRIYFDALKR